jgi:hypothetical protein
MRRGMRMKMRRTMKDKKLKKRKKTWMRQSWRISSRATMRTRKARTRYQNVLSKRPAVAERLGAAVPAAVAKRLAVAVPASVSAAVPAADANPKIAVSTSEGEFYVGYSKEQQSAWRTSHSDGSMKEWSKAFKVLSPNG